MEISQVSDPSNDSPDMVDPQPLPSDFDPKTMRRTKPGCKRLILTLSVLIAFLLGFPFLWKSVDIYRAPLPFSDIDALSAQIESNPLQFPCHFQAIFVGFNSEHLKASKIRSSLIHEMTKMSPKSPQCGSCISNYTVSVVLDSGFECVQAPDAKPSDSWRCGAINAIDFGDALEFGDDKVDEFLESVLGGSLDSLAGGMVYNAVVMNRDEPLRSVVGKYRHAWVLGRVLEVDAIARAAEIFVKVFVNGGKEEGLIPGEFMPVGPDGKIVLSFNLLNADPDDWIYDWDFQRVDEILLTPTVEALAPITNITVESQVLYHTPKASFSFWDDKLNSYILSTNDLPFFVNSNEWHLDTSIAASGRSKILQFVVYIPSSKECPLLLQLPDGGISSTNSFISPMWGGVIIWNPEGCPSGSESKHPLRHLISPQDLHKVVEILMGQFRQLFGLKSDMLYVGESGTLSLLASKKGFTKWELDFLSRKHSCFNLHSCATTLGSLSRLVQSLPRMIIKDEIGKQVRYSIEAANLAQSNASLGVYNASALSSRQARSLAEDAFFHPSIMSVSYYSFEHCFAVYSPFFLPVSLHVLLAAVREWRRYKQETNKYLVWKKAEVST